MNDAREVAHVECTECQGKPLGTPYLARCGRTAVARRGLVFDDADDLPPDAVGCPECMALWDEPCPWCGAETW